MTKGIYMITNTVNGVFYVGSSIEIEKRFQQHKADLRNNHHHNIRLQNAFNKYGEDNFKFEISLICDCSPKQLRKIEQRYIDKLDACNRKKGYNISPLATAGGCFKENNWIYGKGYLMAGELNHFYGRKHTEETRKIISEKNSGFNSPWFGRNHKEESKKKISESHKGKVFTNEHRNNLSSSIKKAYEEGKIKPGVFTEHTRKRQKEACSIPVVMLDQSLNYLREFSSVVEAGKFLGVNPENVTRVCKGKNETSGGYKWAYANEYHSAKE